MEKLLASRINISQPTTERSRGPWFWFWQVQRRKSFKNLWRPPWQPQKQQQQQKWAQIWVVVLKTVSDRRWRSYDFVFIFIFFCCIPIYIFGAAFFGGVFLRFPTLVPLAGCLSVCLFGWPCVPVLGMFLSCLGHIKSLLKASLRPT